MKTLYISLKAANLIKIAYGKESFDSASCRTVVFDDCIC